jgi:hypothetical protein
MDATGKGGPAIETTTSLLVAPAVSQAIEAPDGDEMVKAKIMRAKRIADPACI